MSEIPSGQPPAPPFPSLALQASGDLPFALSQEPVTLEGPHEATATNAVLAPAYEHLGELPATYGTQSVYLVAYDPHRLFVYWDLDWMAAPDTRYSVQVCLADGHVESQVEIFAADAGRYLDIKQPGGTYYVELGTTARDGTWQVKAASGRVVMPPEGLSAEVEPRFATLPFHLSFQRLLELIQNAMGTGEDLTAAMARLQHGDKPQVAAMLGSLGQLSGEQLHTLESLLGRHLQVEGGASPVGGSETNLLRDRPEAIPIGALGREGRLSSVTFGSESLSSAAFGSEKLSSGALGSAPLTSTGAFGSESLSSEIPTLGRAGSSSVSLGSSSLNSELLFSGAFGREGVSSFAAGPNSEAWRLVGGGLGGGSDWLDSERAALFLRAMEGNLDVLSSLFSGFGSPGASDGFSAGGW